MSFTLPLRLSLSRNTRVVCGAMALMAAAATIANFHRKPRPWQIHEVPIAFWAWRNQSPTEKDVRAAIEATHARALFLCAPDRLIIRIRSCAAFGPPRDRYRPELIWHLVYNGTRSLLAQLETVNEDELASTIAVAFQEDISRAEKVARAHRRIANRY